MTDVPADLTGRDTVGGALRKVSQVGPFRGGPPGEPAEVVVALPQGDGRVVRREGLGEVAAVRAKAGPLSPEVWAVRDSTI